MASDSRIVGNSTNRKELDHYPTPHSMTEALFEHENFKGNVYEPACGDGHMVDIIKQYNECFCSDVIEPQRKLGDYNQMNFLNDFETQNLKYDNIITNPPFGAALEFLLKSKTIAREKIAFLLKLDYLHGHERYKKVWTDTEFPLKKVCVFVRRPMLDGKNIDKPYNTGMMTYAWFIWDRNCVTVPWIEWINNQNDIKQGK